MPTAKTDTPKARTLSRALEILGSESALAIAMGVSETDLAGWLGGAPIPDSAYTAALTIVAKGPFNKAVR